MIKIDYYEATERQIKNDDRVNPASARCSAIVGNNVQYRENSNVQMASLSSKAD